MRIPRGWRNAVAVDASNSKDFGFWFIFILSGGVSKQLITELGGPVTNNAGCTLTFVVGGTLVKQKKAHFHEKMMVKELRLVSCFKHFPVPSGMHAETYKIKLFAG